MRKKHTIKWLSEPEAQDYPAAASYLSLLFDNGTTNSIISRLNEARVENFKAKDLFRASSLSLLGISNFHINADLEKIKKNKLLSPLLLVRDSANGKLIIADGYHRLCAVYAINEDELIPCKIV